MMTEICFSNKFGLRGNGGSGYKYNERSPWVGNYWTNVRIHGSSLHYSHTYTVMYILDASVIKINYRFCGI